MMRSQLNSKNGLFPAPLARMAKVEDLFGIVELLCSKSSYITGQNFTVDEDILHGELLFNLRWST